MGDQDGKIVSLCARRRRIEEQEREKAAEQDQRFQDLELRCLTSFYSEVDRFDRDASAEIYSINPQNPLGRIGKALDAADAKDYEGAMTHLEIAEMLYPANREVTITRAMLYANMGYTHAFDREAAVDFVVRAADTHSDDSHVLEVLMKVSLFAIRNPELCRTLYDKLDVDPDKRELYETHLGVLIGDLEFEQDQQLRIYCDAAGEEDSNQ